MGGLDGDVEGAAFAVGAFGGDVVLIDDALDGHDCFDEGFGAWWAAGDVDVYGDVLVDALDDGVGVEDAAGGGAGAHGDDPFGFGHLLVDALEDGEHFDADSAGDDHEVCLAGAEAHDFGAEASEVVAAGRGGHEFDAAAGGGEGHGPDG